MQINTDPKHDQAIRDAVAAGQYANPEALIDDLLTAYETERWIHSNPEKIKQLIEASEQTPLTDLSLDELRDRMTATINRAAS
ncbi:MAG: hypothetical protein AAGH99_15145 [Planctomycetota bacterium]